MHNTDQLIMVAASSAALSDASISFWEALKDVHSLSCSNSPRMLGRNLGQPRGDENKRQTPSVPLFADPAVISCHYHQKQISFM